MGRRSLEAIEYRRLYKLQIWHKLRLRKLRDHPLCERHLARKIIRPATVVNHKTPHRGNMGLFLQWANLESVCKECHDGIIKSEEMLGYSKQHANDGWPADPKHPFLNRKKRSA